MENSTETFNESLNEIIYSRLINDGEFFEVASKVFSKTKQLDFEKSTIEERKKYIEKLLKKHTDAFILRHIAAKRVSEITFAELENEMADPFFEYKVEEWKRNFAPKEKFKSSFDAIIGYEKEKNELVQICQMLKNIKAYNNFGVTLPKGILLEGPPGTGKTLMAWALINESKLKFFHVKKDKDEVEFLKEINEVFEEAIKVEPAIIFFDDLDKFTECHSRHDRNQKEFVAIQTGMEKIKKHNVLVVATANELDIMPESLLRSGRFDKILQINPPMFSDAVKIVKHFLSSKKVNPNIKSSDIVKMMQHKTCADLERVLNEAGIYAVFEGFKQIEFEHITKAIANILFNVDVDNTSLCNDGSVSRIAYHEAGHAVFSMLATAYRPAFASICNSSSTPGICSYYTTDSVLSSFNGVQENIMCSFAGKISEELKFGEPSIGSGSDNKSAYTKLEQLIMNDALLGYENIYFPPDWEHHFSPKKIDRIAKLTAKQMKIYYKQTKKIIAKHMDIVEAIATKILNNKYVTIKDFEEIQDQYNIPYGGENDDNLS